MKTIARRLRLLVPLLLVAIGLLWPAITGGPSSRGGTTADPVLISNLRAEFTVSADGRLQADETITTEFPAGRHGIFRFFDIANANDPHLRQVPDISEITLDGRPVPYELIEKRDRFVTAKIGDPDYYLPSGTPVSYTHLTLPTKRIV